MGPLASVEAPIHALSIRMTSPCTQQTDFAQLEITAGLRSHAIREFLRDAGWAAEARRRPKDFGGLERGTKENQYLAALPRLHCGATLTAAGQWSRAKLYTANMADSDICIRCGAAPETTLHR